jgi:replicative DNA helicase
MKTDIGKAPPNSKEVEEVVLSALIIEPEAILKVIDILNIECFYYENHQIIYGLIEKMFASNEKIDLVSICENATKTGNLEKIGGYYAISQISTKVASASHLQSHAKRLVDLYIRRKLIDEGTRIVLNAHDNSIDVDGVLDIVSTLIDRTLSIVTNQTTINDFEVNLKNAINHITEKQKFRNKEGLVRSPLSNLRIFIPEWMPGDLVVIAARPGMGKTAYALFEAVEMAKNNISCMFFSLEMSVEKLTNRFIQGETGLSKYDFERQLTPEEWLKIDNCYEQFNQLPLFVDDTALSSINHIKAKAKLYKKTHDIKAIFIDYLQLVKPENAKLQRYEQVDTITKALKAIAKELKITVFLLAQLSRKVEERSDKLPILSDLRESGGIEQDADIVIFPFRPQYYWPEESELQGKAIHIIAKNRDGAVGDVQLLINETVTKYEDECTEVRNTCFDKKSNNAPF